MFDGGRRLFGRSRPGETRSLFPRIAQWISRVGQRTVWRALSPFGLRMLSVFRRKLQTGLILRKAQVLPSGANMTNTADAITFGQACHLRKSDIPKTGAALPWPAAA